MENSSIIKEKKIIFIGFIFFLITVGYFLYQEFNPNNNAKNSGKNIGSINQINKDVRQKHAKNINWQELNRPSELFLGDSIFTGELSTAEVIFINGSKMIIQPSSLIVFNQIGEDLNLDLQQGTVRTVVNENNSPVQLKIQGKSVSLSSKDAEVTIDAKGEVQLSKGDIDIKTEIQLQKVNPDMSVTTVEPEEIPQQESNLAETAEPNIIKESAPTWQHDNNQLQTIFSFNSDEEPVGEHLVTLKWAYPEQTTFSLEISTSDNFSKIDYQQDSSSTEHSLQKIKPGKYFARIKKKDSNLWSSPLYIEVLNQFADLPPEPVLVTKKVFLQAPNKLTDKIKWQADYSKYRLEIADNLNFKNSEIIELNNQDYYDFQFRNFETYYIRVAGLTKKGKLSKFSEIGMIAAQTNPPILEDLSDKNIIGLNPEDRPKKIDLNVNWIAAEQVSNFKLQISQTSDFKKANELFINQKSYNFSTDQTGHYFFRVQAVNGRNQAVSEYSDPKKMNYTFILPSLSLPKVLNPKSGFTVYSQANTSLNYMFTWVPVYQAENYLFELSGDPNFEQVIYKSESKNHNISVSTKAPNGKLYWRIKAINSIGKSSSWTEAQPIYFYNGRAPAKAEDE